MPQRLKAYCSRCCWFHPRGELAEKAQRASRRIADHNLRRGQGEGLRPAAVEGLLTALRTY